MQKLLEMFIKLKIFFLKLFGIKEKTREDIFRLKFLRLINNNNQVVCVLFKTIFEGVVLPDHLFVNGLTVLQYGRALVNPIPDLEVGKDGISATLSFNRVLHKTFVPWKAVVEIYVDDFPPVGGTPKSNLLVLKGGNYSEQRMAA